MNNDRSNELKDIGYEGLLLQGILGSLQHERRINLPPKYKKEVKRIKVLQRTTRVKLPILPSVLPDKKSELEKLLSILPRQPILPELTERLSSLAAAHPNFTGIGLEIAGLHRMEGLKHKQKILGLLTYLNYILSEEDNFLRFLFAEKLIKSIQRYKEDEAWDIVRHALHFFSRTEIFQSFLQIQFENKSSISDYIAIGRKQAQLLSFTFFTGSLRIIEPIRKRGYGGHGRTTPLHQQRKIGQDWTDIDKNPELFSLENGVDGKEVYLLKTEERLDVVDQLLKIWKEAQNSFEEFQRTLKEERSRKQETTDQKKQE